MMYLQIIAASQIAYLNAVQLSGSVVPNHICCFARKVARIFQLLLFIVPYYIFFNSKLQKEGKDSIGRCMLAG